MGAMCEGSTKCFHGEKELMGNMGKIHEKRFGVVSFVSFQPKMFSNVASKLVPILLGEKKRKLLAFLESLGSVINFCAYWQYSWLYGAKNRYNLVLTPL